MNSVSSVNEPSAWCAIDLRAWAPPVLVTPAEWAERNRALNTDQSSSAGPLRHEVAPYLVGLMNIAKPPRGLRVSHLTIKKAGQIGASEAVRSIIGYWAALDPSPMMLVLTDETTGKNIVGERIHPLFNTTPALKDLLAKPPTLLEVKLTNGFRLRLGWAGSPATLASDPQRRAVGDETDKWPPFSGREADPISLMTVRTNTYEGRQMIILISTPTTAEGVIHKHFEQAQIKLYYYVPCPHCGVYDTLRLDRLRYEAAHAGESRVDHGARVVDEMLAWYACLHCGEEISEAEKCAAVRRGVWAVESMRTELPRLAARIGMGDVCWEGWPAGTRVGMHLGAFVCNWMPAWKLADLYIQAQGDPGKMMDFRNSYCGETFESQVAKVAPSIFAAKCVSTPDKPVAAPGIAPPWAALALATVDVQLDRFYFVIRAWGRGFRSRRLAHGVLPSAVGNAGDFARLRAMLLEAAFERDARDAHTTTEPLTVAALGIDYNYRSDEVKAFCLSDLARLRPLRGEGDPRKIERLVWPTKITYSPPQQRWEKQLTAYHFDAGGAKDLLASWASLTVRDGDGFPEYDKWELNSDCDLDYNAQMAAEHKVLRRRGRGKGREVWVKISENAANHYWDCENMQIALAHLLRVDLLGTQPQRRPWRERMVRR